MNQTASNIDSKHRHCIMQAIAAMPLSLLYIISDIAYVILYYLLRYRRQMVKANLIASFPTLNPQEIQQIQKKYYRLLADIFVESFKLLNISQSEMKKRVEVRNTHIVEQYASQGQNIYMLMGHLGCWEWVQEVCTRYATPKKNCELYKHISSPYFSSLMHQIRSHWDTEQIEMNQAVRTLLKWSHQDQPHLVGFISDQRPDTRAKDHTTFLNQTTRFIPGAEEIAKKTGAHLLYLHILRPSRGHYIFTFHDMTVPADLANTQYPYTHLYFRMLEENIQQQPELWLWSHNRWDRWNLRQPLKLAIENFIKRLRPTP